MELRDFLYIKLNQLKTDMSLDLNIKVYNEQEFIEDKIEENEISIILKRMTSSIEFNATTIPYQIIVMSEENSQEQAYSLLDNFAQKYNWTSINEGTTNYKFQFSQPMGMQNFQILEGAYRSVLFLNATLFIITNVVDIKDLTIDSNEVDVISFAMSYGASMDTTQYASEEIAKSIKTTSSLALVLTVPSQDTDFVNKCVGIMNGDNGNIDFTFNFKIGGLSFVDLVLKCVAVSFASAKNDVPALEISFIR